MMTVTKFIISNSDGYYVALTYLFRPPRFDVLYCHSTMYQSVFNLKLRIIKYRTLDSNSSSNRGYIMTFLGGLPK